MATTETKTGFRLPWSQDHTETDEPSADVGTVAEANDAAATQTGDDTTASQETERPDMIDATTAATDDASPRAEAPVEAEVAPVEVATPVQAEPVGQAPTRKPNKLMADLAKAMQTAAEGARADTLEKFAADAKTHIEAIQADSATEAADLRRQADDDIAGIRDWSKAEIARIREETEQRITGRKSGLDSELEDHSASTERRIARVQARVDAFEAEMAYFFEVLLAEEDPTKLAAMAQSLPEPPDFDDEIAEPTPVAAATPVLSEPVVSEAAPVAQPDAWSAPDVSNQTPEEVEAALEAIAAAAQAADMAEATARVEAETQAVAAEADAEISTFEPAPELTADPRMAALGLTPDAAAEAEAAAFEAAESGAGEEIPTIDDDALAARIAGLVPDADAATAAPSMPKAKTVSTRVVVVGLVSVASIAGFKRHLGRVAGVQSVGVSSGPDGEFVFVVTHGPDVALRDAIATLPGFGARVTGESDEGVQVTAKDPESES
jgi:hypothetical protein